MNWFKKAQLKKTIPYFQEFEEYGDYIPNEQNLNSILQEKFNTSIIKDIGQGDSGVAYLLSNGDIIKITTNPQETKIAQYLINNPNPNIINYKNIWQEGNLSYIIMEKLDRTLKDYPTYLSLFNQINKFMDNKKCYNINCAIEILSNPPDFIPPSLLTLILDYLNHLKNIPSVKIFDFLNPENIGIKNGKLKFFDIN
jgi:hypothetical protein